MKQMKNQKSKTLLKHAEIYYLKYKIEKIMFIFIFI